MSTRIAVAGWFGSGNLGDELILQALIRELKMRGATTVAVSIDPGRTGRDHGIEAIEHRSPVQARALAETLKRTDGLIVTGGIIQAETSPWNLPFHTARLRAFPSTASTRDRAAAVGLGVGEVRGRLGPALARAALGRLGTIVVRDHASARHLQQWGLTDVAVGADPVLAAEVAPPDPSDTMAVILRSPNRRGLGTAAAKSRGRGQSRRHQQWTEGIARSLDAAAEATGLATRMIVFQPGRDDTLHRAVADRLHAPVEVTTPTLDSVLAEVGRSRLVVAMRYHGAIAALLNDRPAVMIDYSPKMAALAGEGNGWAPLVDPDRLDPASLVQACTTALARPHLTGAARAALTTRLAVNGAAVERLLNGMGS